jgi:hypothetical protein
VEEAGIEAGRRPSRRPGGEVQSPQQSPQVPHPMQAPADGQQVTLYISHLQQPAIPLLVPSAKKS